MIVFGAISSSVVSATVGASVLYAVHVRGWSGFGSAWLIYWLGDSMGVLLVTPLVLTFPSLLTIRPRIRIAEFAALLLLLTVACFVIFGDLPLVPVRLHVLAFAVLPFVMWAAIRFGVSGATLSTLFIAAIATVETALGSGPFAQNTPFTNAVLLDGFFAVLSVSGLTLAAVIAEREQAEREREQLVRAQAAMEARLRLANIVESSNDAIIGTDMDGIITDWNNGAARLYGYPAGEVIGKPASLLIPPDRANEFGEIMGALERGGTVKHYETVRLKKDGTRIEVSLTMSPIREADGGIVGASVIIRDVSERKRQETLLRESEERLRVAAEVGRMYAWEWNPATDSVRRSAECADILGLSDASGEGIAKDYLAFIHPDDRAELRSLVDALTPEDPVYRTHYRRFRAEGALLWLEESGCATFDGDGKMVRLVGMTADITERKQAEEALRRREESYRMFVTQSSEAIFCMNMDAPMPLDLPEDEQIHHILHDSYMGECNDAMASMYGISSAQDFLGKRLSDMLVTSDPHNIELTRDYIRSGFKVLDRESHEQDIHGQPKVFLNSMIGMVENGKYVRSWGIQRDITELKRAERAQRESEDKLRLLLDSTAEAIYGIDLEHRCTFCNPACLHTLGYEHVDEVLGKNMHDLIHHTRADGTSFPADECRVHRVIQAGEGDHAEDEVLWRANGTSFPAEYWSYPQRRGERVVGAVVAFIDITEHKLAEAALANVSRRLIEAQEQERARIGRELHDDIGQRLAMVAVQLQQTHDDSLVLPEVRNRMDELNKEISGIADDIQSLSHELHSAKLQYLGIAAAMKSFCKEFGEQQKVEIDFQSHDLPSPVPPDTALCLFRVLQEALHNSAKHSGVKRFEVRLWGTSGEIQLTVKDSGAGFDREAAKESRGLGLITMEERLKLANGTLSIDSQLKRGTTIHARVPLRSGSDSMRAAG